MKRRNPPAVPADTTPEAWRVQMRAIANLSVQERLALWEACNEAATKAEERVVLRRHPTCTDRQVMPARARRHYGDQLVGKVWPDEPLVEF
ncbi:MAG: hypothetical protein KBF84_11185 [Candidatus Microthrix sp.]|nr:hypothetical protein [Candidatus Microthrix sp.]